MACTQEFMSLAHWIRGAWKGWSEMQYLARRRWILRCYRAANEHTHSSPYTEHGNDSYFAVYG